MLKSILVMLSRWVVIKSWSNNNLSTFVSLISFSFEVPEAVLHQQYFACLNVLPLSFDQWYGRRGWNIFAKIVGVDVYNFCFLVAYQAFATSKFWYKTIGVVLLIHHYLLLFFRWTVLTLWTVKRVRIFWFVQPKLWIICLFFTIFISSSDHQLSK